MKDQRPAWQVFLEHINDYQNGQSGGGNATDENSSGADKPDGSGSNKRPSNTGSGSNKNESSKSSRNTRSGWRMNPEQRFERVRHMAKKLTVVFIIVLILIIIGCYWLFHPPLSIYSVDLWAFVCFFILLPAFLVFFLRARYLQTSSGEREASPRKARIWQRLAYIPVAIVVALIVAGIASQAIFPGNAERYATVLKTETSDFSQDIHEVDYAEIPVIDRDSAALIGNRVMGSIPEYVSQFEISSIYSQINYSGHPVRVSPLEYADFFKWFNNQNNGIPAYVLVDMTTQDAQIVRLEEPIHYTQSDPFIRNIDRHVQLNYPFYLFGQISFEIDDDGNPWWVCPVETRTIGLFGGTTIARVVLCNASTGECQDLAVSDCPTWVDRVYPADLLIEQYNWSGAYSKGWLNSWLGQEGVVQTTPGANGSLGYNYIAKDDDVWVYTGVTSAVSDNSIVGFVLVNQRTAESHFYSIAGATEDSAMHSAQGQVQHLGYRATFPLLLNINSQPTYFMALKDNAGLVKMYAMLDIQRYQNVAVGATLEECQQAYLALLTTNGVITEPTTPAKNLHEVTGTIERITTAVIDGNSHFFLTLQENNSQTGSTPKKSTIYDCALPEVFDVLLLKEGDNVTLKYQIVDDKNIVNAIVE